MLEKPQVYEIQVSYVKYTVKIVLKMFVKVILIVLITVLRFLNTI